MNEMTSWTTRLLAMIALAVGLFFVSACNQDVGLAPQQQVYEHVFNELMQDAVTEILISDRLMIPRDALHFDEALDKLDELIPKYLIDELFKSNVKQKIVWPSIMVNARFIELAENTPKSRIEFWDVFANTYTQGGYYVVSDVILNDGGNAALFVFGYRCSVLCGAHDSLIYLEKVGTKWSIVSGQKLWVS